LIWRARGFLPYDAAAEFLAERGLEVSAAGAAREQGVGDELSAVSFAVPLGQDADALGISRPEVLHKR